MARPLCEWAVKSSEEGCVYAENRAEKSALPKVREEEEVYSKKGVGR